MKQCNECGTSNPDAAKFCKQCGAPLTSAKAEPPAPPMKPAEYADQIPPLSPAPKRNTSLIITIVVCALAVVGAIIWGFTYLGDSESEKSAEEPTLHDWTTDTSVVTEVEAVAVDTAAAPAPEVKETKKAEPVGDDVVRGKGTIDGYPFSLKGKWRGNEMSGTYVNEYNGVTLKFTGYEAEGTLFIELSGGAGSFELDDNCDGTFSGTYYTGKGQAKSATLRL